MTNLVTQKELIPAPRGVRVRGPQEWDSLPSGYGFYSGGRNEGIIDLVLCGGYYYDCRVSHTKSGNNKPGTAGGSSYWSLSTQLDFVATRILLAQYALVKNLGVETIEMKDAGGNVLFQAKNGNVTCKTGTFENVTVEGVIKAAATYGRTYNVTGNMTVNPETDKSTCYVFFASGASATLTLPSPTDYDGLELQFIFLQTMRYAGALYIQHSGGIYFPQTTYDEEKIVIKPGFLQRKTKIEVYTNNLVTIKAIQGMWYVISGFVQDAT